MFGWLFGKRGGEFKPKERHIYRYWDGTKTVAADPLALYKRVLAVGPELSIDVKLSHSASKDAVKGHDAAVAKCRAIFALKPFKEGGLTETEVTLLLDHFLDFCDGVKKNTRTPPTSPTATPPSTEPTSAGPSATPSGSDCGSTASGPSTAEQGPSLTGPASPSAA